MGDYVFMRGTATLKPELVEALLPRFTFNEIPDDPRLSVKTWSQLDLPQSIRECAPYRLLTSDLRGNEDVPGLLSGASSHLSFEG